jgi:hypothetical protein
MMKIVSIILAIASLGTGLIAAWTWYKASKVQIDLGYIYPGSPPGATFKRMGMEFPRTCESGEPELQRLNEMSATWDAISEASQSNKVAAIWTAASVALGGFSAIASALA